MNQLYIAVAFYSDIVQKKNLWMIRRMNGAFNKKTTNKRKIELFFKPNFEKFSNVFGTSLEIDRRISNICTAPFSDDYWY